MVPARLPNARSGPAAKSISDIRELKHPQDIHDEISGVRQPTDPMIGHALHLEAFGATDRGMVRKNNEDQFVLATLTGTLWIEQSSFPQKRVQSSESRGHLLVVADGMGGHASGEEASTLAVEEIESFTLGALTWLLELRAQDTGVLEELKLAIQQAHNSVTARAATQPEMRKMGTTVTLAYTIGDVMYVAHAGDSRCYLLRDGKLRQITRDHTVVNDLIAAGAMQPDQVADSTMRHMVTNVVGGGLPGVRAEVHKFPLLEGDTVLLCTDGLTEMIADEDITQLLLEEAEPQQACDRLIARANRAGGRDNVTAIVARFSAPASGD